MKKYEPQRAVQTITTVSDGGRVPILKRLPQFFICPWDVPTEPGLLKQFMASEVERLRTMPVGAYYTDGQRLYRKAATGQLEEIAIIPLADRTSFRFYERGHVDEDAVAAAQAKPVLDS